MVDNLNVNVNTNKCNNGKESEENSPTRMIPCQEQITIMKTEVKEEVFDFDMPVDGIEFVNVKEENVCLDPDNITEDSLEVIKSSDQFLNKNLDFGKPEFRKVYHQENMYRCELCNSTFEEEIFLKNHYEQCPFMEQTLSQKRFHLKFGNVQKETLKQHLSGRHSCEPRKYKCGDCKYVSNTKQNLQLHIRTHTKDKPFKCLHKACKCTLEDKKSCECNTCEYAATTKGNLKLHILVRHSEEPKKYMCGDCKYATHIKEHLERHKRTHTKDRPFECSFENCRYAATCKSNLKEHILLKHSEGPKKYKCKYCKYAAHKKIPLEIHIRTHTNDRPFKCTYKNCNCTPGQKKCKCNTCGYAAKTETHLKLHILARHSGKRKKYKCKDYKYVA